MKWLTSQAGRVILFICNVLSLFTSGSFRGNLLRSVPVLSIIWILQCHKTALINGDNNLVVLILLL